MADISLCEASRRSIGPTLVMLYPLSLRLSSLLLPSSLSLLAFTRLATGYWVLTYFFCQQRCIWHYCWNFLLHDPEWYPACSQENHQWESRSFRIQRGRVMGHPARWYHSCLGVRLWFFLVNQSLTTSNSKKIIAYKEKRSGHPESTVQEKVQETNAEVEARLSIDKEGKHNASTWNGLRLAPVFHGNIF